MATRNGSLTLPASDRQSLDLKLEFAILGVLIHYNGSIEESLVEWYSALRLGLPQLVDPRQLREVFKRLRDQGIIELDKPNADDLLSSAAPFKTALTRQGAVLWNTVQVQVGGAPRAD